MLRGGTNRRGEGGFERVWGEDVGGGLGIMFMEIEKGSWGIGGIEVTCE